jgi:peptide/nickel transport system permease protein
MVGLLLGKFFRSIATLWIVTIVIFGLARISGNPVTLMLPTDATPADARALTERLGLNHSYFDQYLRFIWQLLHGNLGTSIQYGTSVGSLIFHSLPNTLLLALAAIIFALVVALPLGVLAANRPTGVADHLARGTSLLGQSVPPFVIGIVLVLVFAVHLHLFPASGKSGFSSIVLPAITLGGFATAAITRMTRSSTRDALASPYIIFARSKGLPERIILFRHALRNAATSILTMTALQFVLFANGVIVVEMIFNWPGMGLLTYNAANGRDFPLIQGIVIVTAIVTITVNLLVDVAYALIDRRITHVSNA